MSYCYCFLSKTSFAKNFSWFLGGWRVGDGGKGGDLNVFRDLCSTGKNLIHRLGIKIVLLRYKLGDSQNKFKHKIQR